MSFLSELSSRATELTAIAIALGTAGTAFAWVYDMKKTIEVHAIQIKRQQANIERMEEGIEEKLDKVMDELEKVGRKVSYLFGRYCKTPDNEPW